MKLDKLLRELFTSNECKRFLSDHFEGSLGKDVWDSTREGAWTDRAFEVVEKLSSRGLVNRQLFEAMVDVRPGKADVIAAGCRQELGTALSYVVGTVPDAQTFPWADYEEAMSPSLRNMLRLAAYDARSRGFNTISTSEIFRVYRALQPWIASVLPEGNIKTTALESESDPFSGEFGASYCVSLTIHGLSKHAEQPYLITEHDVFLDLARFGSGKAARKFAPDGESLDRLNQQARELGVGQLTRHAMLQQAGHDAGDSR